MFLMFVGRVGTLSMVLAFVNDNSKDKYIEYPSENIVL
jgi:Trk-type K+ transport system membrane component